MGARLTVLRHNSHDEVPHGRDVYRAELSYVVAGRLLVVCFWIFCMVKLQAIQNFCWQGADEFSGWLLQTFSVC